MSTQTESNSALSIHHGKDFKGYPLLDSTDGFISPYLEKSLKTIKNATGKHPRTWAVRVDLRLPKEGIFGTDVISRFTKSLKAKITADYHRKKKYTKRVHSSDLRFIWVKEKASSDQFHYHVLLLFNKDAYSVLGNYAAESGNMASRIKESWASAIKSSSEVASSLVYFPENHSYYLDRKSSSYKEQLGELFRRVSYFAKNKTKVYGNRDRSFGYSLR